MADPVFPATPQAFRFGDLDLRGDLVAFTGRTRRRGVAHEYLKRSAQRIEDMARAGRQLEVRLEFLGDNAARDYDAFFQAVDRNPRGLLVHPIAGRWRAFCEGPQEDVEFSRAVDEIRVRVNFIEDLDQPITARPAPDTGTAAQQATTQLDAMDQAVAAYMGSVALSASFTEGATAAVQSVLGVIDTVDDPIQAMRAAITTTFGVPSASIGQIIQIADQAAALRATTEAYVEQATDLFDGGEVQAGQADAVASQLEAVAAQGAINFDYLVATSPSPAGAADAAGQVDEVVYACRILSDALAAARPPTITYLVTRTIDVVRLATILYPDSDAYSRASEILALNRIPTPGAIRAGTRLRIYSR